MEQQTLSKRVPRKERFDLPRCELQADGRAVVSGGSFCETFQSRQSLGMRKNDVPARERSKTRGRIFQFSSCAVLKVDPNKIFSGSNLSIPRSTEILVLFKLEAESSESLFRKISVELRGRRNTGLLSRDEEVMYPRFSISTRRKHGPQMKANKTQSSH